MEDLATRDLVERALGVSGARWRMFLELPLAAVPAAVRFCPVHRDDIRERVE